jgi:alpha-1,3-rhamnosyltransferase
MANKRIFEGEHMKLVSVIVLAYRSAETIIQTLDSIVNQTYKNIELVISDDFSPDNTVEVVQNWIDDNNGKLKGIRLLTSNKNTGIPGNINRALKHSKGDYIKLIAADDFLNDNAISEYVKFSEENPGILPIGKVHILSESKIDVTSVQRYCEKCYEFALKSYKEQYYMLLKQNVIVAPSGSFYPTKLLKKMGGYDESYRWFEDYPMNIKIMHAGYRMGLIDKELVWYRIAENSTTVSRQKQLRKAEAALFFKLRFWYMLQAGMIREALGQARIWLKIVLVEDAELRRN